MKIKKLAITSIFILSVILSSWAEERPLVVTTVSMVNDMAKNIFGDKAEVVCVVPIGADPHLFEPTAESAKLVNKADLALMNGLYLEGKWFQKLIENSGTKAEIITVTKGIQGFDELMQGKEKDPHAWMAIPNAVFYCKNILETAKELLPQDAAYFENNFEKYKKELEETEEYIRQQIERIPAAQRVLITSHDAFQYYGSHYGIRLKSTLGVSTEADVQTADIIQLQKVIKETGVPAIFIESTVNPKLIKQIAKDNNVAIGGELYADSVGKKGSGADTYIDMMRHNTDVIVSALTQEPKYQVAEKKNDKSSSFLDSSTYLIIGAIIVLLLVFLLLRKKSK